MDPTTNMDSEKRLLLPPTQEEAHEPTLSELQANVSRAQRAYMRAWSRTTSGKWHKRIMLSVTIPLLAFAAFCLSVIITNPDGLDDDWTPQVTKRVPLEAHIMSKCPDAKDCLHDMILPAMQQISSLVDFKLSYIGRQTDHDDGVECMHGPSECLGNIIELCSAKLYPDPKMYLGFTMCLTREFERIPEESLVSDCALEHGIDMERINGCAIDDDGALAVDALKASFNRTKSAGVTKSCTVRLNGEVRCIRDGGEWTDCEGGHQVKDLVRDVKDLASGFAY